MQLLNKTLSRTDALIIAKEVLRQYIVQRFGSAAEEREWLLENALIVPEWTTQTLNNYVFWWTDRFDLRLVDGAGDRKGTTDRFGHPGPIIVDKWTGKSRAFHSETSLLQTEGIILIQPGKKTPPLEFDCPYPELFRGEPHSPAWRRTR